MKNKSLAIGVLIGCVAVVGLRVFYRAEGPMGVHVGDTIGGREVVAVGDEWIEINEADWPHDAPKLVRISESKLTEHSQSVQCPHY